MKNERLIAMVDFLLHKRRASAEDLARHFEVSVRTIYRDVDSLCAAGVPIVALPGAGGGYEVAEGYSMDRSFLSPDEIADLSSLLRGLSEAVKDPHLERSLGKISALGRGRGESDTIPPPFIADLAPWGGRGPTREIVSFLRKAIELRKPVSFEYLDTDSRESKRTVEPLSIVMGGAVWYLHAWCRLREDFRLFRIARMASLRMEAGSFSPEAHAPIPHPFSMMSGDEVPTEITISATAGLTAQILDVFPGAETYKVPPDRITAKFWYPEGSWLARMILSLGPGVQVIHPETLRLTIVDYARRIAVDNAAQPQSLASDAAGSPENTSF